MVSSRHLAAAGRVVCWVCAALRCWVTHELVCAHESGGQVARIFEGLAPSPGAQTQKADTNGFSEQD